MGEISYALFSTLINERIISELKNRGDTVHLIPPLTTQKIEFDETSKAALKDFSNIDWLIFPDVFTVDHFIDFLRENEIDLFDLDLIRICAFGEAVSDRLRFSEIHADVIAAPVDSESIFNTLNQYIGETGGKTKVVLLKQLSAKISLSKRLKAAGYAVSELSIYRQIQSRSLQFAKAKVLITGGEVDEVVLSDPADLVGLEVLFGGKTLNDALSGINLSVVNNVMLQMLFEHGFNARIFQIPTN